MQLSQSMSSSSEMFSSSLLLISDKHFTQNISSLKGLYAFEFSLSISDLKKQEKKEGGRVAVNWEWVVDKIVDNRKITVILIKFNFILNYCCQAHLMTD